MNHGHKGSDDPSTVPGSGVHDSGFLPAAPSPEVPLALHAWEPFDDGISVELSAHCSSDELRDGNCSRGRKVRQERQIHIQAIELRRKIYLSVCMVHNEDGPRRDD